eukprot:418825-Pelagomonas_calceolata.AAC.1
MQVMMNRLRAYAMRKGLTVGASKSNVALPEKEQFRYLSMLVDKHINFKISEEHAVRPYMAAQQRI